MIEKIGSGDEEPNAALVSIWGWEGQIKLIKLAAEGWFLPLLFSLSKSRIWFWQHSLLSSHKHLQSSVTNTKGSKFLQSSQELFPLLRASWIFLYFIKNRISWTEGDQKNSWIQLLALHRACFHPWRGRAAFYPWFFEASIEKFCVGGVKGKKARKSGEWCPKPQAGSLAHGLLLSSSLYKHFHNCSKEKDFCSVLQGTEVGKSDLLIYFPSAVCAGCFFMGYLRKF